ncbi:MAG: elongation factor G [Bacteroidales bacterium]|nr:elongation factor G [Bacteroidales bacterium]
MKEYKTNEIRNIALIGSAKSGKTTLAEAMLFECGVITRRGSVDEKNTVSDYRDIELERQNSIFSSLMWVDYNAKKINIIDTPGFDDFIGDTIAALNVADTALMLVNAQNGVEVGNEITFRHCNKLNMPLVFVINQLEHEKANFDETLRQLKTYFSEKITLVQYPVNAGPGFNSIIDLLMMKLLKYPAGGGKPEILDIPEEEKSKAEELHTKLIEAAAEGDDSLMELFFETGSLTEEQFSKGIRLSLLHRNLFPVFCTCAKHNMGVQRLLQFVSTTVPSPLDMPAKKTTDGKELKYNAFDPVSMLVFKTSIEPHLGEVSFFKVYAGELTEGIDLYNTNTSSKERLTQLFYFCGKNREKVAKITAGDIGATIKLKNTKTNNTLNSPKNQNDQIEPIIFPNSKYKTAIKAKSNTDDEKLNAVLTDMSKTDPTLLSYYSRELKQMIIEGQGELQINIMKWHLDNIHKIDVELFPPRIQYRETITKPAKSMYRHKKQSGGAGQFGEVHMMIQPFTEGMSDQKEFPIRGRDSIALDWGGKLLFHNCIVGGAIDARFMPAILKGIMEKMEEGPLTGSYARDIVVNIYDGKMHPVDSNEISFRLAGRNAFREAFKNAGPKILEPIFDVEIFMPEDKMGDVITDIQGRRGMIMGMDNDGRYQVIKARVPLAEMNKYSTSLSSITSGRGTFDMKFAEYVQVSADIQDKLLKEHAAKEEEEE